METINDISSYEQIQKDVQMYTDNFQFIDTIASFVQNNEFKHGYTLMNVNNHEDEANFWRTLSAIGCDFGETLYSEVRNYIDKVSNIETCKITALKSMLEMMGQKYQLIDNIKYYPIEVVKLMDILSINRKYLLQNGFMKDEFLRDLSSYGIISNDISAESHYVYDDNKFHQFVTTTISAFLYDMLAMRINEDIYAYSKISGDYGTLPSIDDQEMIKKKNQYNIKPGFDQYEIADNITNGSDSLDNYSGYELSLLNYVIEKRKQPLDSTKYQPTTRYFYYKSNKVLEIARFIDNTYSDISSLTSVSEYDYDKNFIQINKQGTENTVLDCDTMVKNDIPQNVINEKILINVSEKIAQMIKYIGKIRETLKYQARKIFIKGTNNIIRLVVNDFMIDYIENINSNIRQSDTDKNTLSAFDIIYNNIRNHSLSSVQIQEYSDETEYMNLSTATTYLARNREYVNDRFFDEYFSKGQNGHYTVNTPKNFTNEQINDFYLDVLGLDKTIADNSLVQNDKTRLADSLYDFLSVIFDIGANTSYYSQDLSIFGAVLSDGTPSTLKYYDLSAVEEISTYLIDKTTNYCQGYVFDKSMALKEQYEDFKQVFYGYLSCEFLSAVSVMYDAYYPTIESLSTNLDNLRYELENLISSTYSYYFCKSDNEYCYEDDGSYTLDYFIGNDAYISDDYFEIRWDDIYNWIQKNCHNWPILCACSRLSGYYIDISSQIQYNIVDNIVLSGYNNLNLVDLEKQMDDIDAFLDKKITLRTNYLTDSLNNFRNQAQELKITYDGLVNGLNQILAGLPDTSQGYYFTEAGTQIIKEKLYFSGEYSADLNSSNKRKPQIYKRKDVDDVSEEETYDMYSGTFYQAGVTGKKDSEGVWHNTGEFDKRSFSSIDDSSFTAKANSAKEIIEQLGQVYFGNNTAFNVAASKEPLDSIITDYTKLSDGLDSLINQLINLFQLDQNDDYQHILDLLSTKSQEPVEDRIIKIIEILGTSISEKEFAQDAIISSYNSYKVTLSKIRAQYLPYKDKYNEIWSMFATFVMDFTTKYSNTYMTYTLDNVLKLNDFTVKQDAKQLVIINTELNKMMDEYLKLQDIYQNLEEDELLLYDSKRNIYDYSPIGDVLEEQINHLYESLLLDIDIRTQIGNEQIDEELENQYHVRIVQLMEIYYKYLKNNVIEYDENKTDGQNYEIFREKFEALTDKDWFDTLIELKDFLNYREDIMYKQSENMFKTYSGVPNVAYDPYYNHKNLTHPSYQMHPFLWNFVEINNYSQTLNKIVHAITNLNYDSLEQPKIVNAIDSILNKFGAAINTWNTDFVDYSGYTTRYETSTHICKITGISSEVVDYDGSFYPKAIDKFREGFTTIDELSDYYIQLKPNGNDKVAEIVNSQLSDAYDDIMRVTEEVEDISAVYDIYKYEMDSNDNIYILFKKYEKDIVSAKDKLETKGELWIRTKDSPIALPVRYHYGDVANDLSDSIMDIYDFHILPTGDKIVFTYRWNDIDDTDMTADKMVKTRSYFIRQSQLLNTGIRNLGFTITEPNSEKLTQTNEFPSKDIIYDKKHGRILSYMGMFDKSSSITNVLYISHELRADDEDLGVNNQPTLYIYSVSSNKTKVDEPQKYELADIENLYIRTNPPFCPYTNSRDEKCIDLAFAVDKKITDSKFYKGRTLNIDENSVGAPYDSITDTEMNSHDILMQNIKIRTINLDTSKINSDEYNTNADMGYIPSYPGLSSSVTLDIHEELDENYQSIELLGSSKNIDDKITNINSNTNPYITKEDILSNGLFGMVYEDFDITQDKSLNTYENIAMYPNMPISGDYDVIYQSKYRRFQWDIDLSQYSEKQLSNLTMIMYNVSTLGKNPYVLSSFKDLLPNSYNPNKGAYTEFGTNYTTVDRYKNKSYDFESNGTKYKVIGSCNGIDEANAFYSNTIDNIRKITFSIYTRQKHNKKIRIYIYIEDKNIINFIPENQLRVVLINAHDMEIFELYHFLDVKGLLSNDMSGTYFYDGNNVKRYMKDIHLSDYNDIRELNIFDSYDRLSFKYSVEDVFDANDVNYYFPGINVKIPYTFGSYYNDTFVHDYVRADDFQYIHTFDESAVYIMDTQFEDIIQNIDVVDITQNNYQNNDVRVYEDYNGTYYDKYGTERYISELYSPSDPKFYQYTHLFENGQYPQDCPISVDDELVKNTYIEENENIDAFSQWCVDRGIYLKKSESGDYTETRTVTFRYSDLSYEQKLDFKKNIYEMLKIYVSYKKTDNGIALQFNQQNYTNPPFIEIIDGKRYQIQIDRTFATVEPNEVGYLDVMIQMCSYTQNQIYGVKNILMATYQIHNLSDDKPKFIIRKMTELEPETLGVSDEKYCILAAEKTQVQIDDNKQTFDYYVRMNSNFTVSGEISCSMIYDTKTMVFLSSENEEYCTNKANGWLELHFDTVFRERRLTFQKTDRAKRYSGKPMPMVLLDTYIEPPQIMTSQNGYVIMNITSTRTFTVKFVDYDGTPISSYSEVKLGEKVTPPPFPDNREGYRAFQWDNSDYEYVNKNLTCTAEYQIIQYNVGLNAEPSEGCKVIGAGEYDYGEEVTIRAEVNEGYKFFGWQNSNDKLISRDSTHKFIIDRTQQMTALTPKMQ